MTNHEDGDILEVVTTLELETIDGGSVPPTSEQIDIFCGDVPLDLCQVRF